MEETAFRARLSSLTLHARLGMQAERLTVTVGEPDNAQQLRHTYASEIEALEAA
ncbi:hypothetical protein [Vreelandella alkaliphila]|uniref:Uncharacterized protein n=1 Tax=Vreelandella alkaliphila TaxID=272774 RepID=A0A7C9P0N1_9GAMM|nr:hypothetical protein [Halomonas alkaliphila]NDL69933.1 hypothetical protein [Halomonas alkaliphila]